ISTRALGTPVLIEKMYASREVRGTGVATALCRATLADLAVQGQRFVWLGTHKDNARANAFYARMGFEVIGERRFVVGGVEAEDWVYLGSFSTARG
ncbi:GNAT family N-acetyltransferase, partial [Micrococcus luteus]|uniref:GNAT family N-acetyltransferase n=1 Tax=Micrococcus luteus TaxID=1270 RepID=UPI00066833A8